jgi:hypothetical protein
MNLIRTSDSSVFWPIGISAGDGLRFGPSEWDSHHSRSLIPDYVANWLHSRISQTIGEFRGREIEVVLNQTGILMQTGPCTGIPPYQQFLGTARIMIQPLGCRLPPRCLFLKKGTCLTASVSLRSTHLLSSQPAIVTASLQIKIPDILVYGVSITPVSLIWFGLQVVSKMKIDDA